MISETYDNLTTTAEVSLGKSYIISENQNKVFDAKLPYWFSSSAISDVGRI